MASFLTTVHQVFGYVLFAGMLGVAALGFVQAARETTFDVRPFQLVAGLVSLQLLIGIGTYVATSAWDRDGLGIVAIHPVLMVLGTGMAHAAVSRGRRMEAPTEAWRGAGTMLAIATVFVTAGIGVASAA